MFNKKYQFDQEQVEKFKFIFVTLTMELKIINLNFLNIFLIILTFFRKQTGYVWCFSIFWLKMSAKGLVVEPKIGQSIQFGLSWPNSLLIGVDRKFLFGSPEFFRPNN